MEKQNDLALEIKTKSLSGITNDDAIRIYQNARNRTNDLTIIASGADSAVCLMLASRFMPDKIHIFPLLGCGVDKFLSEVKKRVSFLYFICAPIRIYLSNTATDYEKIRINRLLKSISSFQKEIVYVENEFDAYMNLTNPYKTTKTLA